MKLLTEVLEFGQVELGELDRLYPSPDCNHPDEERFLTPLLDPQLPDTIYHAYSEIVERKHTILVAIRPMPRRKSYEARRYKTLKARYNFRTCNLLRSSEYHQSCAHVSITPPDNPDQWTVARDMSITTSFGKTIIDKPDRKKFWSDRRFTYGGRRFVWLNMRHITHSQPTLLYEVKKEWPKEGSTSGKVDQDTFSRPLIRIEKKVALTKLSTIYMAGGLDQRFREFLLAGILADKLVDWTKVGEVYSSSEYEPYED